MQFQFHHEQFHTTTLAGSATAVLVSSALEGGFPLGVQTQNGIVLDSIYVSGLGTASSVLTLTASGVVVARVGYPANGGKPMAPVHIKIAQGEDLQVHASATCAITVNFHRALI